MKKCNLSEDLAEDRSEWRNIIRVADPNIVGTQGFDNDDEEYIFNIFFRDISPKSPNWPVHFI